MAAPHRWSQQFWAFGTLRCLLIPTDCPATLSVQVLRSTSTIYTQCVSDPDEAAQLAENLWRIMVESPA